MAKFRELRARITGVENTAKITSAMKMVAAAKLRRAQDAIIAARPYGRKLQEILQFLASTEEGASLSPLFEEREAERVAVVIVAADRGLCGAFNTNVMRAAMALIDREYAAHRASGRLDVITVGKRAVDFFARRSYNVVASFPGIFGHLEFSVARHIVGELTDAFLKGRVDRVVVVYTEFRSAIKQTVLTAQFLPIPKLEAGGAATMKNVEYIFEPARNELLESLLPKYLNTRFWNMLLDSNAAEQGARMTAMENATRNAKDLVRSLRLSYNKARQASITTEILEIVSGAEALREG
jgi:F-type H+-transporting ATPase subunit gamma